MHREVTSKSLEDMGIPMKHTSMKLKMAISIESLESMVLLALNQERIYQMD